MKFGDDYFKLHRNELELQAQDELLRIGEKEGWSKEDINEIRGAKDAWQKAVNAEKKK